MEEIWREIEGYPNYRVSNLGNVKSLNYNRTGKEKKLKTRADKAGYLRVKLCKDGIEKILAVHRLVAMAFLDNSDNLPQCNHIDEDKKNNCVDNLEWCTVKYNNNYGTRKERAGKKISEGLKGNKNFEGKKLSEEHKKKLNEAKYKPVLQIDPVTNEIIKEWESIIKVERTLGFHHSAISRCCLGKQKAHKGFKWRYKEESVAI